MLMNSRGEPPFGGYMLMNSRGGPPHFERGPPLGTIFMDLVVCIRNFMIFLPDIVKFMDKLTALLCSIGESCSSMLCMLQNTNAREYTKLQQCPCCSGSVAQLRTTDT